MGFSNMMMAAARSIPKSTISQSIPSLTYSSCSTTNMWWLKNCWSFSLTKLMEICSKPLYSKISKPAMSRTATKLAFFQCGIDKRVVTLDDQPLEDPVKDRTGNATHRTSCLFAGLSLGHPLRSDLDPWLAEVLDHHLCIDLECTSHLTRECLRANSLALSLVVAAFGNEIYTTAAHDASSEHVAVKLLLCRELEDIECVLSVHQLFVVIDGLDLHLALGDVDVVEGISTDAALCTKPSFTDAFA